MGSSRRSLCVLLVLLLVGGSALLLVERAARAAAAEATGPVTIVLQDGTEIIGEIVEERADAVVVKTAYGQMTLSRKKIREIRREKIFDKAEPPRVNVEGHDAAPGPHALREVRRLPARCRAEIQDPLSGLRIHQTPDQLGRLILNPEEPLAEARQLRDGGALREHQRVGRETTRTGL